MEGDKYLCPLTVPEVLVGYNFGESQLKKVSFFVNFCTKWLNLKINKID